MGADFKLNVETVYEMELSVVEEEEGWRIRARVWSADGARPLEPTIEYRFWEGYLLFPLAGRAVLTATPFSGESVEFSSAELYEGEYIPVESEPEDLEKEAGSEE